MLVPPCPAIGPGSAPGWNDETGAGGWPAPDCAGASAATDGNAGPAITRGDIPGEAFGRLSTVDGTNKALSPVGRGAGASPPWG